MSFHYEATFQIRTDGSNKIPNATWKVYKTTWLTVPTYYNIGFIFGPFTTFWVFVPSIVDLKVIPCNTSEESGFWVVQLPSHWDFYWQVAMKQRWPNLMALKAAGISEAPKRRKLHREWPLLKGLMKKAGGMCIYWKGKKYVYITDTKKIYIISFTHTYIYIYASTFQSGCQLQRKGWWILHLFFGTIWHPNWRVQAYNYLYRVYLELLSKCCN